MQKPPTFTGKNYDSWMMKANLYIRANKKDFPDDERKILFVLSFMTEGMPEQWANWFVDQVETKQNDNFGTWTAFKTELKATFEDKDKSKKARTALHALKQEKSTAEEFFLQFELLRREAGIEDEGELIAILEGGAVDRTIINQVYSSNFELPSDYADWKKKIIQIDGLRRRMKMNDAAAGQRPAYRPLPTPPRTAQWNAPRQQAPTQNVAPAAASNWRPGPGRTYGGLGKPMDLDEAKRQNVCYKCQQPGHIGKFCPNFRPPAQTRQQDFSMLPPPPQYYVPPPPQQQLQQPVAGPSMSAPFDVRKLGYDDMKKMVDAWQEEQKKAYGDAQRAQSNAGKLGF